MLFSPAFYVIVFNLQCILSRRHIIVWI